MPSYARKHIVDETRIGVYQCIGRCVRRAFLCGTDAVSGRDFSHRKVWLQGRLESLASVFAVEICTFSVMSNHFHALLRIRPDIAAAWSDEEVAYRWACVRAIYRKGDLSRHPTFGGDLSRGSFQTPHFWGVFLSPLEGSSRHPTFVVFFASPLD